MADVIAKRPTSYYINSAIAISLMLFFRFIPPFGQLTPLGMTILGIFLGAIYAWCTVELVWPSFLALICLGFTEYTTVTKAFQTAAQNETILTIMFFMCLAALVSTSGLGDVIANKLLSLKIAQGRPWVMSSILLAAAYVAAILIRQMPAIILCWTFLYKIAEEAKMEKHHTYVELMVVGIVYSTIFAQCLLPWFTGVLINFGLATSVYGAPVEVSYAAFMGWSFVSGLAAIALYVCMCKFVIRPDVSALKNIDTTKFAEKTKLNNKQKVVGVMFLLLVFSLLASSLFPSGWAITQFFKKLGTLGTVMLFLGAVMLVPYGGQSLGGKFKELADGIAWDLIIMIASALTLAGGLTSEGTGIKPFMSSLIVPLLGDYSAYIFLAIFLLMALVLTNFINNVVVSAVMLPIVVPMADSIAVNPAAITALFTLVTTVAILLPSASPSGAMMHSNREYLSAKHALLYALYTNVGFVIIMLAVAIPLAMLML